MNTGLVNQPMTRRNDVSVKLDEEVVRIARLVAEYKETSLAAYLSDLLRPLVTKDLEHEQATFKLPKPKGRPRAEKN